jgi:hypothetical protein
MNNNIDEINNNNIFCFIYIRILFEIVYSYILWFFFKGIYCVYINFFVIKYININL